MKTKVRAHIFHHISADCRTTFGSTIAERGAVTGSSSRESWATPFLVRFFFCVCLLLLPNFFTACQWGVKTSIFQPDQWKIILSAEEIEPTGTKSSHLPLLRGFCFCRIAEEFNRGQRWRWGRDRRLSGEGWAGVQGDWGNLSRQRKTWTLLGQSAMHCGGRQNSTKNRWAGKQVSVCLSDFFLVCLYLGGPSSSMEVLCFPVTSLLT